MFGGRSSALVSCSLFCFYIISLINKTRVYLLDCYWTSLPDPEHSCFLKPTYAQFSKLDLKKAFHSKARR